MWKILSNDTYKQNKQQKKHRIANLIFVIEQLSYKKGKDTYFLMFL